MLKRTNLQAKKDKNLGNDRKEIVSDSLEKHCYNINQINQEKYNAFAPYLDNLPNDCIKIQVK